jgi:hypothetical protein
MSRVPAFRSDCVRLFRNLVGNLRMTLPIFVHKTLPDRSRCIGHTMGIARPTRRQSFIVKGGAKLSPHSLDEAAILSAFVAVLR